TRGCRTRGCARTRGSARCRRSARARRRGGACGRSRGGGRTGCGPPGRAARGRARPAHVRTRPRGGAREGDAATRGRRPGPPRRPARGPEEGGRGMIANVSAQDIAFSALAIVGIIAALRMVTTKNVVHGALYLVIALSMIGAGYLVMAAEFVAWVQIVIYV